ncbi:MAG: DUF4440 domain-containing protein [Steroidobacteraceae bacterium]
MLRLTPPFLFLLAMTLTQVASADPTRDAIESGNRAFAAAVAKGDAAAVSALYTQDAVLMPAAAANVTGAAAIQKYWQGALSEGVGGVKFTTREVYGRGPTATEVGEYEITAKSGQPIDHGKYIVVWKRTAGRWQLHRDMFSTSVEAKPSH